MIDTMLRIASILDAKGQYDLADRMERIAEIPLIRQCMYCRRVFDEESGQWLDLREPETNNVSHGICPECTPMAEQQWQDELREMMGAAGWND